jgi:hypothetical protein
LEGGKGGTLRVCNTPLVKALIKRQEAAFEELLLGRDPDSKVFTKEGSSEPLKGNYLTDRVNSILGHVSATLGYRVTTQTFRLCFAARMSGVGQVEVTRNLLGNKTLSSMERYPGANFSVAKLHAATEKSLNALDCWEPEKRKPRKWAGYNRRRALKASKEAQYQADLHTTEFEV